MDRATAETLNDVFKFVGAILLITFIIVGFVGLVMHTYKSNKEYAKQRIADEKKCFQLLHNKVTPTQLHDLCL